MRHTQTDTFVTFEFEKNNEISSFNVVLVEPKIEELEVPQLDRPVSVRMPSQKFKTICAELKLFGDHVEVQVGATATFRIQSDRGTGFKMMKRSDDLEINVQSQLDQVPQFSIRYLDKMAKAAANGVALELEMRNGAPHSVTYKYDLGHRPTNVSLNFWLAPRIDV